MATTLNRLLVITALHALHAGVRFPLADSHRV
jgi:hypothetical protein